MKERMDNDSVVAGERDVDFCLKNPVLGQTAPRSH